MTARVIAVLAALSIASPAFGQSKATCAAYMAADVKFYSTPAIRDGHLLTQAMLNIANRNPVSEKRSEMLGALERAIKALDKSRAVNRAWETRRRAHRKAYWEPVARDERAVDDLVREGLWLCQRLIGYENWPSPYNVKGERP